MAPRSTTSARTAAGAVLALAAVARARAARGAWPSSCTTVHPATAQTRMPTGHKRMSRYPTSTRSAEGIAAITQVADAAATRVIPARAARALRRVIQAPTASTAKATSTAAPTTADLLPRTETIWPALPVGGWRDQRGGGVTAAPRERRPNDAPRGCRLPRHLARTLTLPGWPVTCWMSGGAQQTAPARSPAPAHRHRRGRACAMPAKGARRARRAAGTVYSRWLWAATDAEMTSTGHQATRPLATAHAAMQVAANHIAPR